VHFSIYKGVTIAVGQRFWQAACVSSHGDGGHIPIFQYVVNKTALSALISGSFLI
jgi:hypothetical protein